MLRQIIKRWVLISLSLVHFKFTSRVIKVLQQSIGFGFDSGIKHEVEQFLEELDKFNLVKPVVLDVGANIGDWSKLVTSKLARVEIHAFEPSRETFLALKDAAKALPNVHIHNFGCGAEDSSRDLYFDEIKSGMASLSKRNLKHLNINFENFESVEIRRLDNFLNNSSIKPDGIKIDVEGHELEVLKGLGGCINELKVIQFEFGGTDIDSRVFFRDFCATFLYEGEEICVGGRRLYACIRSLSHTRPLFPHVPSSPSL